MKNAGVNEIWHDSVVGGQFRRGVSRSKSESNSSLFICVDLEARVPKHHPRLSDSGADPGYNPLNK